jgi:YHS domain-containing protein
MELLDILLIVLSLFAGRAFWRIIGGIMEGLSGDPTRSKEPSRRAQGGGVPQHGVQMARDPICGTYVVPERAVALNDAPGGRVFFCSIACRDQYRAQGTPGVKSA